MLARCSRLEQLLTTSGLLATGPRSLMACYREVLDHHGYSASTIDTVPPAWWDGTGWRPQTKPLVLLHFGNSYVVAESFDAHVRDPERTLDA